MHQSSKMLGHTVHLVVVPMYLVKYKQVGVIRKLLTCLNLENADLYKLQVY